MREHRLKTVTFQHLHPLPANKKFSEAEPEENPSSSRLRPYKVCGGETKVKKGIVAGTFQELVEKAKKKFPDAGDDITLVLLEDKTEIDDEEYFQSLEDNTVFLIVPTINCRRSRQKIRNCDKYQEKRQTQKSRKNDSDSGLKEISKLLAKAGTVTGRGEMIEKTNKSRSLKIEMVDMVTQVDAVTIEFEIDKAEGANISRQFSSGTSPPAKHLAAQLINKLEKHKKILEKERKIRE